jgi:hypothetical protein
VKNLLLDAMGTKELSFGLMEFLNPNSNTLTML